MGIADTIIEKARQEREKRDAEAEIDRLRLDAKFAPKPAPSSVQIVDISIPFWSMVVLLIKLAIAALPATMILTFCVMIMAAMFK